MNLSSLMDALASYDDDTEELNVSSRNGQILVLTEIQKRLVESRKLTQRLTPLGASVLRSPHLNEPEVGKVCTQESNGRFVAQ